ncbi:MAG: YgjV family protein [Clostridia bacterium]|nr:YgjV family protein [Clostridia bacterium]
MLTTLSLIFGYIATAAAMVGFQLKKQSQIIISQMVSNSFIALSYFMLGTTKMAGGFACVVGALQTLINYFYLRKKKNPKKYITAIFFFGYVASFVVTAYLAQQVVLPNDLLPLIGSMIFVFAVSIQNSTATRIMFFFNMLIWITFDCIATPVATANLITHICILISVIVGFLRYDLLKMRNNNKQ